MMDEKNTRNHQIIIANRLGRIVQSITFKITKSVCYVFPQKKVFFMLRVHLVCRTLEDFHRISFHMIFPNVWHLFYRNGGTKFLMIVSIFS